MSFVLSTIEDAIYSWVNSISATTVIWRFQNGPAPTSPYITLNISNFKKVGWDYQTLTDENGKAALMGNREFSLEINYYGTGGVNVFEKLTTSLQSFPVVQALTDAGIAYIDKLSQQNLTGLSESTDGFEERQMMELKFRCSNQGITAPDLFDTGIIQTTEVGGQSASGEGNINTDLNIGDPYTPPP